MTMSAALANQLAILAVGRELAWQGPFDLTDNPARPVLVSDGHDLLMPGGSYAPSGVLAVRCRATAGRQAQVTFSGDYALDAVWTITINGHAVAVDALAANAASLQDVADLAVTNLSGDGTLAVYGLTFGTAASVEGGAIDTLTVQGPGAGEDDGNGGQWAVADQEFVIGVTSDDADAIPIVVADPSACTILPWLLPRGGAKNASDAVPVAWFAPPEVGTGVAVDSLPRSFAVRSSGYSRMALQGSASGPTVASNTDGAEVTLRSPQVWIGHVVPETGV